MGKNNLKTNNLYTIIIYILWIAIFKIFAIPSVVQKIQKTICILIVIVYITTNVKKKKYYFNKVGIMIIWMILTCFISYIREFISASNLFNGIMNALCIELIYIMVCYGMDNNKKEEIINSLYHTLLIYVICSLVSIWLKGSSNDVLLYYFAGNKFRTTYYIIMFDVFYAIKFDVPNKRKIRYLALIILTIIICYYVRCSTTVVASLLLTMVYIKKEKARKILSNKILIMLIMFIATVVVFFITRLLGEKWISYIIVNILGENLSLTGRLDIYKSLFDISKKSPIFGFGYGNSEIAQIVGYGNAQNSMFQTIIETGYIGAIFFIIVFYQGISNKSKKKVKNDLWPAYIYVYITIICASIEVTFNYMFYSALFYIYAIENQKSEKKESTKI